MHIRNFSRLFSPISIAIMAVCALGVITIPLLTPPDIAKSLMKEDGPVEDAQAVLYGIAVTIAGFELARHRTYPWLAGTAMTLWALLRELDFQKAFTYRSVESFGFYLRPAVPWWQKVLALLLYSPFIMAGLYLVRLIWKHRCRILTQPPQWLGHFTGLSILILSSLVFEKMGRMTIGEEMSELGMALMTIVLVFELKKQITPGKVSMAQAKF